VLLPLVGGGYDAQSLAIVGFGFTMALSYVAIAARATARRARRRQSAACRRIARRREEARFPRLRMAILLIGVASLTVAGGPGRAVPAPNDRHDRQR
jgi:ABC-type Fe3+ transport system permease subunit